MKKGKSRTGCILWNLLIVIVLLLAGGLYFGRSLPDIGSQIPNTPMMVTIGKPASGDTGGVGSPLAVSAQVTSPQPIAIMELWVDGHLAGNLDIVPVGVNQYWGSFSWIASTSGEHTLIVRATDAQGRIGVSDPVQIKTIVATQSMKMETFVAKGGETLDSLASKYQTTVPTILAYNGDLTTGQALKAGQQLQIPIPFSYAPPPSNALPVAPLSPEGGAAAASAMSPIQFWLETNLFPSPSSPLAAPGLSAAVQGCNASLSIMDHSNNEAGFFLYRTGPNHVGFEKIATLGPHPGNGPIAYADQGLSGSYNYYAAAFNQHGESAGPVAQAAVGNECAVQAWDGDLQLDGELLRSKITVDRAYFYVSINGGNWARVPSNPYTFLPAVQGGYDIRSYLRDLAAGEGGKLKTLSIDGWGWSGSSLTHLGRGNGNFSSGQSATNLAGLYLWTTLDGSFSASLGPDPTLIHFSDDFGFAKPANFLFRWKTGSGAQSGRWQVSRSPYFLPDTILAEGVTDMNPGWNDYSYFNIPFHKLLAKTANIDNEPAAPLMQGPVPYGSEQSLQLSAGQGVYLTQPTLLPSLAPVGGQNLVNGSSPLAFASLPPLGGGKLNEYYVRLTPMNGNQIAGDLSNTVIVRFDPESGNPGIQIPVLGPEYYTPLYTVEILDYMPGAVEDPNSWGCVKVVKVYPGAITGLNVGDIHCPDPYTGGGTQGWNGFVHDLGTLAGWVGNGLNDVSKLWQDLKGYAVKLLLKYTPLGLQCQFAENVVLPEGTCQDAFAAAVDVGLASMGVPPSLPNFDQLMDQGLDYAVEMGAQEVLKDSPVPCVGPCEDAVKDKIRQTLKSAINEVAGQSLAPSCVSEQEAHENGREPWCPPPGVVVKPAVTSIDSPPTVLVRVTRRPDVPDPANIPSCTLRVSANYTYSVPPAGYPAPTGHPFTSAFLPIPPLAPGQSFQVAVSLTQKSIIDFPWDSPYKSGFAFHHWTDMVYYGTSHADVVASFVTPPYVQGTPASCAEQVTSPEENSPNYKP